MKFLYLFIFLLIFPPQVKAKESRRIILTIGISHFKDKTYHNLKYASKDGTKLGKFLEQSWKNITYKKNLFSTKKKNITKKMIMASLREIQRKNFSKDDIVIIYISTHGTLTKNKRTAKLEKYLVTSTTDSKNIENTGFPFKKLQQIFRQLKSQKKALILDSCFSGTGKSVFSNEVKEEIKKYKGVLAPYEEFNVAKGEILLFSSQGNEPSQENRALGGSVYTYYLLEGLKKDRNQDGVITLTEAHDYARARTSTFTKGTQNPTSMLTLEGVDPIYIKGHLSDEKALIRANLTSNQIYEVFIDGEYKGLLDKGVVFPSGKRKLILRDPRKGKNVLEIVYRFKGGKEYSVSTLLRLRPKNHSLLISYGLFNVLGEQKSRYLPQTESGLGLQYIRRTFWNKYDIRFSLDYYKTNEENPSYNKESFIKQIRKTLIFSTHAEQRESLPFLSRGDGHLLTSFYWGFGPSLLSLSLEKDFYNINNKSVLIYSESEKTTYRPGLSGKLGVSFRSLFNNLYAELGLTLHSYLSPFDDENTFLFTIGPHFSLGYNW
jgi:hypothetical protein